MVHRLILICFSDEYGILLPMINESQNFQNFDLQKTLRAKHISIPSEHGAWIFLLSPLTIGLFIGGFSNGSLPLIIAMLSAFLIRQPLTTVVKIKSGRRPKKELGSAIFWLLAYGLILLVSLVFIMVQEYGFIFYLAVPAIPVFLWHLWLVSKRAERRQKLIEIAAGGVLALAAPAAYWVGQQDYSSSGWMLWVLSWMQVSGTILYAYLRLRQRQLTQSPTLRESIIHARETILFNFILFFVVLVLAIFSIVPAFLPIAFIIQPIEIILGVSHPAIKVPPKQIGIRQLVISILFTIVFILTWLLS